MSYSDTNARRTHAATAGDGTYPPDLDRLENLDDWQIAEGETDPRGYDLIGRDGQKIGTIENLLASPSTQKAYFVIVNTGGWFQNKQFAIPLSEISLRRDEGKAYGPFSREQFQGAPEYLGTRRDFSAYHTYWTGLRAGRTTDSNLRSGEAGARAMDTATEEVHVPLTEETAQVRKEQRETGSITLRKRVDVETEHISEPVTRTRVEVERRQVAPGEQYAADANATTLREGEELRVPVVEEELVVQKVPRVAEEVVVRTQAQTEQVERDVELRRERVEVDEEGDVDVEAADDVTRRR